MATEGRVRERAQSSASTKAFVVLGQSLLANYVFSDSYTPTGGAANLNLNPFDGGLYRAVTGPALGPNGTNGCIVSRVADLLITEGDAARVISVNIATGGTTAAAWAPGGNMNHRIGVACKRLLSLGISPAAVLWEQGQNDAGSSTTEASYRASLQGVRDTVRGSGVTCPIIVARSTWSNSLLANSGPIRAAQAGIVDDVDFFAGPDSDTLGNSYRADGTHWNSTGAGAVAALWRAAIIDAI
jgi:hypothetical protein